MRQPVTPRPGQAKSARDNPRRFCYVLCSVATTLQAPIADSLKLPTRSELAALSDCKPYPFRRLVIVGNRAEIELQRYRSEMSPKAILHTLSAFEVRYDLPICYFPDAEAAALQVESWLWWVAREIVKSANALFQGVAR